MLNAQAKEQHISEIWYWDPSNFRDNGQKQHAKEYLKILDLVGLKRPKSNLDKGLTGISRISVPFVVVINHGDIEIFADPPIKLSEGLSSNRYQDGFMFNKNGQVLGVYIWDNMITGYQVPAEFKDHLEWLNRAELIEPMRENLCILLNISACSLCSP